MLHRSYLPHCVPSTAVAEKEGKDQEEEGEEEEEDESSEIPQPMGMPNSEHVSKGLCFAS